MCYVKTKPAASPIALFPTPSYSSPPGPIQTDFTSPLGCLSSSVGSVSDAWLFGDSPLLCDLLSSPGQDDLSLWLSGLAGLPAAASSFSLPQQQSAFSSDFSDATCIVVPNESSFSPPALSDTKTDAALHKVEKPKPTRREKNTDAARKSRARKAALIESLESKTDTLEQERASLHTRIAVLENNQRSFVQRESDLKTRVAMLEKQLAESHRALLAQNC
ncbi:hypothetical protein HDU98_010830 [Podochytrium sp. JEL0797]|nr:hypothetical protein HDU98_010830 [Podochytrium sp. JEL0797]